jgi:hypothetical protein
MKRWVWISAIRWRSFREHPVRFEHPERCHEFLSSGVVINRPKYCHACKRARTSTVFHYSPGRIMDTTEDWRFVKNRVEPLKVEPTPLQCDSKHGHDVDGEDPNIPDDFSWLIF